MDLSKNFCTIQLDEFDAEEAVANVYLCGYGIPYDNAPTPNNHWSIFLETTPRKSVKVDIIPGGGPDGLVASILLESKKYDVTDRAVKSLAFSPKYPFPVKDIINLIME